MSEESKGRTGAKTAAESSPFVSMLDGLSVTGFSIICAWHFLVIFTAIPVSGAEALNGRPLLFQLALYISLALSYVFLSFTFRPLSSALSGKGASAWRFGIVGFGAIASLATLLLIFAKGAGFYVELASWIIVGCSEAFLMFPWLQLPQVKQDKMITPSNFAFNMGIGGVVAFIIGNLVTPYNFIALVLLPLAANISILAVWSNEEPVMEDDVTESTLATTFPAKALENSHFIFYGISFGLCQFIFSAEIGSADSINFIVTDSWPICGVIISALIIVLASARGLVNGHVLTIQHFSSLIYIAGIMGAFYFVSSFGMFSDAVFHNGMLACEIICFAGFNTFDFGFMIFAFFRVSKFKSEFTGYICFNRAVLYLSMGIGMALGLGMNYVLVPVLPNHLTAVVAAVVVFLTISMLPVFDKYVPLEKEAPLQEAQTKPEQSIEPAPEEEKQPGQLDENLEIIADEHGLSKRERQVFAFLAQGMGANDIQQELWISIHTVKTHMSSVYHKLNVHSARELVALVNEKRAALEENKPIQSGEQGERTN